MAKKNHTESIDRWICRMALSEHWEIILRLCSGAFNRALGNAELLTWLDSDFDKTDLTPSQSESETFYIVNKQCAMQCSVMELEPCHCCQSWITSYLKLDTYSCDNHVCIGCPYSNTRQPSGTNTMLASWLTCSEICRLWQVAANTRFPVRDNQQKLY